MSTPVVVQKSFIAANKFGLGASADDLVSIDGDPEGWLLAQVPLAATLPLEFATLPASALLLTEANERLRQVQRASQGGQPTADTRRATQLLIRAGREQIAAFQALRLRQAIATRTPFAERLLRFWSNYFTVAAGGNAKRAIANIGLAYENEAIRLHLDGSFADLLVSVVQHPAMLIYLDNAVSVGPASLLGRRRERGLNENLAREVLELHTLGVDGGYSQDDVSSLARMLTGWTVAQDGIPESLLPGAAVPGSFQFIAAMHEPGPQRLLGRVWRAGGLEQAEGALRFLAEHPATARQVATRLARHFVSDQPPAAAIAALEQVFLDTRGDLPSLHAAVASLGAAWDVGQRKFRTPEEYVIAVGRALGLAGAAAAAVPVLQTFGQEPFSAPSPAGWPDAADFWSGPDALLKRIEWVNVLSHQLPAVHDARLLAAELLPPDPLLQQEVSRAESSQQALALLLASPAFQWR